MFDCCCFVGGNELWKLFRWLKRTVDVSLSETVLLFRWQKKTVKNAGTSLAQELVGSDDAAGYVGSIRTRFIVSMHAVESSAILYWLLMRLLDC